MRRHTYIRYPFILIGDWGLCDRAYRNVSTARMYSIQLFTIPSESDSTYTHTRTQHPDTFTSTNDPCWSVQFPIYECRNERRATLCFRFSHMLGFGCHGKYLHEIRLPTHTNTYTSLKRLLAGIFRFIRHLRYFSHLLMLENTSYTFHVANGKWFSSQGMVYIIYVPHELDGDFNFWVVRITNISAFHCLNPIKETETMNRTTANFWWHKPEIFNCISQFRNDFGTTGKPNEWGWIIHLWSGTGCNQPFGMFYRKWYRVRGAENSWNYCLSGSKKLQNNESQFEKKKK